MKRTSICLLLLLIARTTFAGVEEGMAAMEREDYQKAYKELLPLAESGDDKAMITIGLMYHQGQGLKQDYDKAMDWYIKAFQKGNGDAYSNIGVMYRDGLGASKNKKMAYCLFLITHVTSLGSESTQLRTNSCLRRIIPEMTKEDLVECFNYTQEYTARLRRNNFTMPDCSSTSSAPQRVSLDAWAEGKRIDLSVAPITLRFRLVFITRM